MSNSVLVFPYVLRLPCRYRAFVSDLGGGLPVPPDAGGIGTRASLG